MSEYNIVNGELVSITADSTIDNEIWLSQRVEIIEEGTFNDCENVTRVVIPKNVREIIGQPFSHCLSLETIALPEDLFLKYKACFPFDCNYVFSDGPVIPSRITRDWSISVEVLENHVTINEGDLANIQLIIRISNCSNSYASVLLEKFNLRQRDVEINKSSWLHGYELPTIITLAPGDSIKTGANFILEKAAELQDNSARIVLDITEYEQHLSYHFDFSVDMFLELIQNDSSCKRMEIPDVESSNKITAKAFVVKTNLFHCTHNDHFIETINATVNIIENEGMVIERSVTAGYCKHCNQYFLLHKEFKKLRSYGILLCRLISDEVYRRLGETSWEVEGLKDESILHQLGYSVNQKENLSEAQRHQILIKAVEYGLYSINEICGFLDWLISNNSSRSNFGLAISKWENDREFINNYNFATRTAIPLGAVHS
jgi:hypothetical protein